MNAANHHVLPLLAEYHDRRTLHGKVDAADSLRRAVIEEIFIPVHSGEEGAVATPLALPLRRRFVLRSRAGVVEGSTKTVSIFDLDLAPGAFAPAPLFRGRLFVEIEGVVRGLWWGFRARTLHIDDGPIVRVRLEDTVGCRVGRIWERSK